MVYTGPDMSNIVDRRSIDKIIEEKLWRRDTLDAAAYHEMLEELHGCILSATFLTPNVEPTIKQDLFLFERMKIVENHNKKVRKVIDKLEGRLAEIIRARLLRVKNKSGQY